MITVNGDAFTTEVNGTSAVTLECTENKTSRVTRKFHSESVNEQKIKETKTLLRSHGSGQARIAVADLLSLTRGYFDARCLNLVLKSNAVYGSRAIGYYTVNMALARCHGGG